MSRRRFVVAYDIREPKRLRRVHKAMKGFGDPLQYSVFVCDLDQIEKLGMVTRLGELIDHAKDRIAIVDIGDASSRGVDSFEFMGRSLPLPVPGSRIV